MCQIFRGVFHYRGTWKVNSNRLLAEIKAPLKAIQPTKNQKQLMIKVIDTLSNNLPDAFSQLKSHI